MGAALSRLWPGDRLARLSLVERVANLYGTFLGVWLLLWFVPYSSVLKQRLLYWLDRRPQTQRFAALAFPLGLLAFLVSLRLQAGTRERLRQLLDRLPADQARGAADGDVAEPRRLSSLAGDLRALLQGQRLAWKALGIFVLSLFVHRAAYLMDRNVDGLISLEMRQQEREMLQWKPPSPAVLRALTLPLKSVLKPVFLGSENIPPNRPLLFVSNHTLMALDFPLILEYLARRQRIWVRALADHSHFQIPVNAQILSGQLGAVDGTRRNVDLLMQSGACLWVYPGGARETFKKTTDAKYALIWGDRMGFAAQAVKHGCTIVPVINYGTEDLFKVVSDVSLNWVPVPFLFQSGRTVPLFVPKMPMLRKHVLPGRTHRARVFFWFAPPIHTERFAGRHEEEEVVREIRDRTKQAIEDGLDYLKRISIDYERYYGQPEPVDEDPEEEFEEDGAPGEQSDAPEAPPAAAGEDLPGGRAAASRKQRKARAFLSSWSLGSEDPAPAPPSVPPPTNRL